MKIIVILSFMLVSSFVFAVKPSLNNLSQTEVKDISKELAANFVHTAVSHAGTLGDNFGFEIGLIAGATATPKLKKLVLEEDPSADVGAIPHAGFLGILTVPFGITGELTFIPDNESADIIIKNTTFGLKWTLTHSLIKLPFDFAVRGHYSKNSFSYKDRIGLVDTTVSFDSKTAGINAEISADLVFITPYAGIGFVSGSTDILLTGNVSIFDFTATSSASSSQSGAHYFIGLNSHFLFIFNLGAEYSNIWGVDKYTAKLSIGF